MYALASVYAWTCELVAEAWREGQGRPSNLSGLVGSGSEAIVDEAGDKAIDSLDRIRQSHLCGGVGCTGGRCSACCLRSSALLAEVVALISSRDVRISTALLRSKWFLCARGSLKRFDVAFVSLMKGARALIVLAWPPADSRGRKTMQDDSFRASASLQSMELLGDCERELYMIGHGRVLQVIDTCQLSEFRGLHSIHH